MGKGKTTSGKQATKRRSDAATKTAPFNPGDRVQRRGSFARGTVLSCSNVAPFKTTVDIGDDSIITLPARQFQLVTDPKPAKPAAPTEPGKGTWKPDRQLKAHPLAELLPAMAETEFQALKTSIADAKKIEFPIVLYQGQIIDGRNRYRACCELGIAPTFREFVGSDQDAVEFVYRCAMHRNMDGGQKACSAVKFTVKEAAIGRAKKLQNLHKNKGPVDLPQNGKSEAFYHQTVSERFGVPARYVAEARTLLEHDPKLFQEVFDGREKLARAVRTYRRTLKSRHVAARAKEAAASVKIDDIRIIPGDCLELSERELRKTARLIFCDPPYNIGIDYGNGVKADKLPDDVYLANTEKWMREAHRLLTMDGSLWVLICDEYAAEYAVLLKRIGFTIRSWIKWFESFGNNCQNSFNRTSRHLFYCVMDPGRFVFDPAAVNRRSDREQKYKDARAVKGGKVWDDVWGINPPIPRLVENAKERLPDFPTQLPLALVKPIVLCASEPGDLVMDFFSGSGTTAVACLLTDRKFTGFEKNRVYAEKSLQRVLSSHTRSK